VVAICITCPANGRCLAAQQTVAAGLALDIDAMGRIEWVDVDANSMRFLNQRRQATEPGVMLPGTSPVYWEFRDIVRTHDNIPRQSQIFR